MFLAIRKPFLIGPALLALGGCTAVHHAKTSCTTCTSSVIVATPSIYENYTPPQPLLSPIPSPPNSAPVQDAPLPPETRNVPDRNFDFFDAAESEDSKPFRR
jgi:hypothetical protein